jgi:coproporphyrinogen III oxidase-like Fe-S oxidoreductase
LFKSASKDNSAPIAEEELKKPTKEEIHGDIPFCFANLCGYCKFVLHVFRKFLIQFLSAVQLLVKGEKQD